MITTAIVTTIVLLIGSYYDIKEGKIPLPLLLFFIPLAIIEFSENPLIVILLPLLAWLLDAWALGDMLMAIGVGLVHRSTSFFLAWLFITLIYALILKKLRKVFGWKHTPGILAMLLAYLTLLLL